MSAKPGETNRITVRQVQGGIAIDDSGGTADGPMRADRDRPHLPRERFGGVDVYLGDGNDTLEQDVLVAPIVAGSGNDDIRVPKGGFTLVGNEEPTRIEATGAADASVLLLLLRRTAPVSATVNGIADDGEAGEGDNLIGAVTGITGGEGSDDLVAGRMSTSSLVGNGGNDMLLAARAAATCSAARGTTSCWAGTAATSSREGPARTS